MTKDEIVQLVNDVQALIKERDPNDESGYFMFVVNTAPEGLIIDSLSMIGNLHPEVITGFVTDMMTINQEDITTMHEAAVKDKH